MSWFRPETEQNDPALSLSAGEKLLIKQYMDAPLGPASVVARKTVEEKFKDNPEILKRIIKMDETLLK